MAYTVAFFGTPRFAVSILNELEKAHIIPALIITAPDKPAGRGLRITPPPVKDWAVIHDVAFIQPQSLTKDDPDLDVLLNSEWDLFIVAAYGKILSQRVLDVPTHGTLNVHPSLLPRFRGASPIESQILADEKIVGISIMQLDAEMDHGPILAQASITPDPWPLRARDLEDLLATEGGALLAEAIHPYMDGLLKPEPQDHTKATFTKKIEKADGLLDFPGGVASRNYLKFCAYDEWPGTFFFRDGKRIKIVDAVYENGTFLPLRVVPEGKKEQDFKLNL